MEGIYDYQDLRNISFEILIECDLEKYIDSIWLQKPMVREAKKKQMIRMMGTSEKNITNYRKVIKRANLSDQYYKFPIDQDKDNFPIWRKDIFDKYQDEFNAKASTSIVKIKILKLQELANVVTSLSMAPFYGIWQRMTDGQPVYDYKVCAAICGIIDHIKEVQNREEKKKTPSTAKYKILKDIFISTDAYNRAIEALIIVTPPVISKTKEYLLSERSKSAFAAWHQVVIHRGMVKSVPNNVMATLLNSEISELNLYKDGGTLGDFNKTASKSYYKKLLAII